MTQDHKCGAVQDYCTFHDTKIFYCIFCKKVISAKREPVVDVSVTVVTEDKPNYYDDENLKDWV